MPWTLFFGTSQPYSEWAFSGLRKDGREAERLPKICHIYLTMMKLSRVIPYLKKIKKYMKKRDAPLDFCWHQHFLSEINKFCYIKKYRYKLHFDTQFLILLTFFWVFKDSFNKNVYNFDDVSKDGYSRPS